MSIFKAYKTSAIKALGMPKLWLILFGFNILFALCITLPLKGIISGTVGNSLSLNESLERFNFTFITDFLNQHGEIFLGYLNQSIIFIIAFLFFSLFVAGGYLEIIVNRNSVFKARHFWGGSGHYFFRMVRLFIYFTLIHLIIFVMFWFLFARQGLNPLKMQDDHSLIARLQWMVPIFAFVHIVVAMMHDFAKIRLVKDDTSIISNSIIQNFKWVGENFGKCLGFIILNIVIGGLLFFLYHYLKQLFPTNTNEGILLAFLVAQIFIIVRIGLKLVYFGGLNELYINK